MWGGGLFHFLGFYGICWVGWLAKLVLSKSLGLSLSCVSFCIGRQNANIWGCLYFLIFSFFFFYFMSFFIVSSSTPLNFPKFGFLLQLYVLYIYHQLARIVLEYALSINDTTFSFIILY